MVKILLSSRAFINKLITENFINLLGEVNYNQDLIVIIVNSVTEGKTHPKMIELQKFVNKMGFKKVVLFDVSEDDQAILFSAKAIILNGGYQFILLDNLIKYGYLKILRNLVYQGKPFYGISAGAIVLGPDLSLYANLYPEDDLNKDSRTTAIGATSIRVYPHYDKHSKINDQLEKNIKNFELRTNTIISRLDNEQGIFVMNDQIKLISPY
ncbi:Type 1 glutamine amidotransferase-like domain-containing protein [Leuconostoc miyukkimchii]|uniref:Type 1 glutamine amidotransferase-like domain-containing protein n=1 Tax=Leuconostoc miyukkimchii TaxID=910540 RepID=UPI001C7E111E|nr:Type 1 glutamine amidotransferase-like domain-containing protein [Leuconostoc miyukkimchii]